jgi:hypothetical protein
VRQVVNQARRASRRFRSTPSTTAPIPTPPRSCRGSAARSSVRARRTSPTRPRPSTKPSWAAAGGASSRSTRATIRWSRRSASSGSSTRSRSTPTRPARARQQRRDLLFHHRAPESRTVYDAKYPPKEGEEPVSATTSERRRRRARLGDGDGILRSPSTSTSSTRSHEDRRGPRHARRQGRPRGSRSRATRSREDQAPPDARGNARPAIVILKERETVRKQVKWALINGIDILDGNADKTAGRDLPGSYIPVVPVIGEELIVNGKRNLRGMVRDAISRSAPTTSGSRRSPRRSRSAPRRRSSPRSASSKATRTKWNNANLRNYPYLEYNAGRRERHARAAAAARPYDPDISAALQMTMQADRDLKSVIGMFDASQERSPEQSGKAILARQQQGEEGTSHFLDNLSRSIEHTGRILIEWIPVYYDTPRMLRINGLDDQPRDVLVHAGQGEAANDYHDGRGRPVASRQNIMSRAAVRPGVGRYDVSISVGPSYQSRRQESVEIDHRSSCRRTRACCRGRRHPHGEHGLAGRAAARRRASSAWCPRGKDPEDGAAGDSARSAAADGADAAAAAGRDGGAPRRTTSSGPRRRSSPRKGQIAKMEIDVEGAARADAQQASWRSSKRRSTPTRRSRC